MTESRPETRSDDASDRSEASTPAPDSAVKPDSPTDLHGRSWKFVLRRALREFSSDQCTDIAASLTYYAVLALFPAIIALVSLLGVVGQAKDSVDTLLAVLRPLVSADVLKLIEPTMVEIATSPAAGTGLFVGLLGALWSASGYVGAFSRAMNRIYEIPEGRPFWKLRPQMLLITLVAIVLIAAVLLMLVISGPVAESLGRVIGLESTTVTVWTIAKWPILLVVVMLIVAMLYYATPNVKQPKFRWISVGAAAAILIWVVASVGFALYVSSFGNYNKTYGSLAGVVVALLFIWITNLALLLGAEIDSELERGRELQAGIPAEEELQLPARDTRQIEKNTEKEQADIERGRRIRQEADPDGVVAAEYLGDQESEAAAGETDPDDGGSLDSDSGRDDSGDPEDADRSPGRSKALGPLAAGAAGIAIGAQLKKTISKEDS